MLIKMKTRIYATPAVKELRVKRKLTFTLSSTLSWLCFLLVIILSANVRPSLFRTGFFLFSCRSCIACMATKRSHSYRNKRGMVNQFAIIMKE